MKKLSLNKETLRSLTDQDATRIAGGLPAETVRYCDTNPGATDLCHTHNNAPLCLWLTEGCLSRICTVTVDTPRR